MLSLCQMRTDECSNPPCPCVLISPSLTRLSGEPLLHLVTFLLEDNAFFFSPVLIPLPVFLFTSASVLGGFHQSSIPLSSMSLIQLLQ